LKNMAEIQTVVEALDYDFDRFELNHFLRHIESLRRRQLIVQPFPFTAPSLYGMWVRAASADYIFYSRDCHPIHQIHTVLHEVGHMLLGHPCRLLDQELPSGLLASLALPHPAGHLRAAPSLSLRDTPEEQECELFAGVIQRKVFEKKRLHLLTGQNSSIGALKPYVDSVNPAYRET